MNSILPSESSSIPRAESGKFKKGPTLVRQKRPNSRMRNRGAANAPKAAAARPTRSNFRRRGAKTVGAGYNWIRDIDGVRNMRRSILLVDAAAGTLRHGAAPHL